MPNTRDGLLEKLVLSDTLEEFTPENTRELMQRIHASIGGGGTLYVYVRRGGVWQLDTFLGAERFYHSTGFAGTADAPLRLNLRVESGLGVFIELPLGTKLATMQLQNDRYPRAVYLRQPHGEETLCLWAPPSRVSPRP